MATHSRDKHGAQCRNTSGGFRLFHCSANKPSGWTKAVCDEHLRARFRRQHTRAAVSCSSRLKWAVEPSADEAQRTAEIITTCCEHHRGLCNRPALGNPLR